MGRGDSPLSPPGGHVAEGPAADPSGSSAPPRRRGEMPPFPGARAMAYEAPDFFDADGLLTDEERAVRDTVRSFVEERIIPVAPMAPIMLFWIVGEE